MQPPQETIRKHGNARQRTKAKNTGTLKHQKEGNPSHKSGQTHKIKPIKSQSDKDPEKGDISTLATEGLPQEKKGFKSFLTGLQPKRQ